MKTCFPCGSPSATRTTRLSPSRTLLQKRTCTLHVWSRFISTSVLYLRSHQCNKLHMPNTCCLPAHINLHHVPCVLMLQDGKKAFASHLYQQFTAFPAYRPPFPTTFHTFPTLQMSSTKLPDIPPSRRNPRSASWRPHPGRPPQPPLKYSLCPVIFGSLKNMIYITSFLSGAHSSACFYHFLSRVTYFETQLIHSNSKLSTKSLSNTLA